MTKRRQTPEEFLAALERTLEARRERIRRKRKEDPGYFKQKQREFLVRNPGYSTAANKAWRQNNRAYVTAKAAEKRAQSFGNLPLCYDLTEVIDVYELAEEFRQAGFKVHVDHIVPLQHPLVCGLHTLANLRPCTAEGNNKKGNDYPSFFLGY